MLILLTVDAASGFLLFFLRLDGGQTQDALSGPPGQMRHRAGARFLGAPVCVSPLVEEDLRGDFLGATCNMLVTYKESRSQMRGHCIAQKRGCTRNLYELCSERRNTFNVVWHEIPHSITNHLFLE